jgi:hypothetical protein
VIKLRELNDWVTPLACADRFRHIAKIMPTHNDALFMPQTVLPILIITKGRLLRELNKDCPSNHVDDLTGN